MISLGQPLSLTTVSILGAILGSGLISAWLARLSVGSKGQTFCQSLFFACLALVGGATLFSLSLTPVSWMGCGATMCTMVLTAIWDFGSTVNTDAA